MTITKLTTRAAAFFLATILLAGCKVTDDKIDSGFTGEQSGPTNVDESDSAPVIWGDPDTSVLVGTQYVFQPEASDTDGDVLEFAIANKPKWATFDKYSGVLQGIPGSQHVGRARNIVISVTDEDSVVSLASFDITVEGAGAPAGGSNDGGNDTDQGAGGDSDDDGAAAGGGSDDGDTGGADADDGDDNANDDANDDSDDGADNGADDVVVFHPPVISGTPRTSVVAGNFYMFQPKASDADGDDFSFSVVNKPSWATFNTVTGRLQGTPTGADIGTSEPIDISVTDGMSIVALERFTITVEPVGTVSKTISWTPPTENEDGTPLTDLTGYRIYYGAEPGEYTEVVDIDAAGLTSYMIDDLVPGTYYLAMTSINSRDMESAKTPEISFTL